MSRRRPPAWAVAVAVVATACGAADSSPTGPTATATSGAGAVVGYYGFTESEILAHIYGGVLASEGLPVHYQEFVSGAREVIYPDLGRGGIDLIPEYLGSALVVGFGDESVADPDVTIDRLRAYLTDVGAAALAFAPGEDKNGFAVTRATADAGIATIADLEQLEEVRFLGPPECEQRLTCLRALTQTYGLDNVTYETEGATDDRVHALTTGEADMVLVFTTQPVVSWEDLVLLDDPLGAIPAENIVPIVSQSLLDAHPGLADAIDRVTAQITTDVLIELNRRVEVEGESPSDVAADWLAGARVSS